MFQSFFLCNIACVNDTTPREVLRYYNAECGLPTPRQREMLVDAVREIFDVATWQGFYARLGLPVPNSQQQASTLRQAVAQSALCGYHAPSEKALRSNLRNGAKDSHSRQGRRQLGSEKLGVKQDLQRAYSKVVHRSQQQQQPQQQQNSMEKSAGVRKATPKVENTAKAKAQSRLKNRFAAMQSDSDSESD